MKRRAAYVILATALMAGPALAEPYAYPSRGQSEEQVSKDRYDCYVWAKKQTAFDPADPPPIDEPRRRSSGGGGLLGNTLGGAAVGALLGAVGGAIAGNAGKGAAIGAGVGGTAGAVSTAAGTTYTSPEPTYRQGRAGVHDYNRAFSACMEGRGYTVR